MFALVVALALAQASPPPASELSPQNRSASLFTSPRVPPIALVGRTGMGLLFGSLIGGALSGALIIVGGTLAASGLSALMALATPLAIITLGLSTALGAAMFGEQYGRDFVDALVVAVGCSVLSVAAVVLLFYLAPATLGLMATVIAGLVFPAVATPLLVQAFKAGPGEPQPAITLARF